MLAAFLDLLYPPRCAACGEPCGACGEPHRACGVQGGPAPFCPVCAEALEEVPVGCPRCGEPGLPEQGPCGACLASPPAFTAVQAGGLYGGPLAEAIAALKYGDRPAVARPLGTWLAGRVRLPPGAVIVPVPLAPVRRRQRGYDQAARLAGHLARATGRPRLRAALRRLRETPPQVGRGRAARALNVAGAFRAAPALVGGRRVVLLDDVVTTGATADAAARALLDAGAVDVAVVALARAGR